MERKRVRLPGNRSKVESKARVRSDSEVGSPQEGERTSTGHATESGGLSVLPPAAVVVHCATPARGVKINRSQQNDKLLAVVAVAERKEGELKSR